MRKSMLIVLGLIAITALLLFFRRGGDEPVTTPDRPAPPATQLPTDVSTTPATPGRSAPRFYEIPQRENPPSYPPPRNDTRFTRTDDGKVLLNPAIDLAESLHDPDSDPMEDLEHLGGILMFYRWVFQQNPVGGNDDIVRQLTGDNPRNVVVLPPDHPGISSTGELLDRFGNPYLFHAISESEMGIWSFGSDGIIGTADDLKLEETGYFEETDAAGE